jgi:dihydrofolate reductase
MIMSKIKLFIATTIDGFIARENGSLDWLPGSSADADTVQDKESSNASENDGGYSEFVSAIDTVVLGRKTYEEILGFGVEWPYGNCRSYVVTSDADYEVKTENTSTINIIDQATIAEIKAKSNKDIWIVGGGQIITQFLNHNAIDEMTLNVFSIILGKGIQLFPKEPKETKFKLIKTESFGSDFVNLTYKRNN